MPRLFDSSRPIAFIHIGKNAGSSMNAIFTKAKNMLHFYLIKRNTLVVSILIFLTYEKSLRMLRKSLMIPKKWLSILVKLCHYHFMQKSTWAKGSPIERTSLNEILNKAVDGNFTDLMAFRGFWQDGQAGTPWLTSTHTADWVASGDTKPWSLRGKNQRKIYFLNHKKMMTEAADNLDRMFWIGIVEDMDRSIELLEHQLGLEKESLKVITMNKNEEKCSVSETFKCARYQVKATVFEVKKSVYFRLKQL